MSEQAPNNPPDEPQTPPTPVNPPAPDTAESPQVPPGSRCPIKKLKKLPIAEFLILASFLLSLLGYWGIFGWPADLASHFKVQYTALMLIGLVAVSIRKRPQWIIIALLGLGMNLIELSSDWQKPERDPFLLPQATIAKLKILHMNVYIENRAYDKAAALIAETNPDIISLQEVDQAWITALAPALAPYAHRLEVPQENTPFGIALYSRIPFVKTKEHQFVNNTTSAILAGFKVEGAMITLLATHTLPPMSPELYARRNAQFQGMANQREAFGPDLIVVGDLNTSPWSASFQSLLRHMDLQDARQGFGWQPTWPTWFPPLAIPLDYVLTSPRFEALEHRLGPDIGSDHRPLIVELGLLEAPQMQPPDSMPTPSDGIELAPAQSTRPTNQSGLPAGSGNTTDSGAILP